MVRVYTQPGARGLSTLGGVYGGSGYNSGKVTTLSIRFTQTFSNSVLLVFCSSYYNNSKVYIDFLCVSFSTVPFPLNFFFL